MASHHHHHDGGFHSRHHNHRENIPLLPTYLATSSPCACADSSPCCIQSPPNLDHLLRLIASYLQNQQQKQENQCSCETSSPIFNRGVRRQSFVVNQQQQKKKNVQREYDNLLRKIDDLDLSLNRIYEKSRDSYSTLKDSAARVIQTHFRSYLVCRSISLRQLKELATIKSSFLSLKASVSGKTIFPFKAVSREAADLLLQLDSLQGRIDPMIRDGKRTLSGDLVRFLHYIDDCALKRRDVVCKSVKDVSFTGKCKGSGTKRNVGENKATERLKKQIRKIYIASNGDEDHNAELEEFYFMADDSQGIPIVCTEKSRKVGSSKSRIGVLRQDDKVKTPVTKTVNFGKNRNVYELTSSTEDDSIDDGEEILMVSHDDGVGNNSRSGNRSGVVMKGNAGKTRVKKTVSFDENGNVYRVYGNTPEARVSEGDDSSMTGSNSESGDSFNEAEDIKCVPKENEGFEEEDEEECSSEGSKEEAQVIENVSPKGRNKHKQDFQLRKGSSMFSPPLPLKMEP